MAINLTEGAIAMLSSSDAQGADVKPVLQVADLRLVNTQNQNSERYRILLSDGAHLQQGMLATQMNNLVKSQALQKGSIVQLTQFVCNVIQGRTIIIIIDLNVILEKCDPIGEPKQYERPGTNVSSAPMPRTPSQVQSNMDRPGTISSNPPSYAGGSLGGSFAKPNLPGGTLPNQPTLERSTDLQSYGGSFATNPVAGGYNATNSNVLYPKTDIGAGVSRGPLNSYGRPPQAAYQQPPPMYANRGPIARNEAPPRIIPIAALNPYQGRWTIKARVTAKGELRHYNNPRGDGKVFAFDLLDSDGGEIRVTCFNAVADQFHNQIEAGKVYLISKGSLKPAQKAFNHLHNDHEIFLESTSTVQLCHEDDNSIPQQQFHFRPIVDVECMESNSIVDVIGVVSYISPSTSIMRKNGTETQKRALHLRDMSGRSVELTLWGQFCNAEGLEMQKMCDSGVFPVLAVKSCRVSDFNGKGVGTISSSQLIIDPDFPEARKLKEWFEMEGRNAPSVSISRETTMGKTDVRKTISQIKDEKLGTSERPDWITVSATISFIKVDNFCYPACPLMVGDRKCSKKVTNNGDGKWRCDRCDQSVDECDYRYILQLQIQDHTGLTWVSAFQEAGEEIMGIPAKDLYYLKYEEQEDERFGEIVRKVLFTKYVFKLKVKEEIYSDEQRVKSTAIKAERVNFSSESRFLLDLMDKLKAGNASSVGPKADNVFLNTGVNSTGSGPSGNVAARQIPPVANYMGSTSNVSREGLPANQVGQYGNQYSSSKFNAGGSTGMYLSCKGCGGTGHSSSNCPSVMNVQGQSYGGGFTTINRGPSSGGASSECYKCHQFGHWARDCPGLSNVPPAYGSGNVTPGRYGGVPNQRVGGF